MTADLLREAATVVRTEGSVWSDPEIAYVVVSVDFFHALADLLDHCAKFGTWRKHVGDGPTADLIDLASGVAAAYLGRDS